MSKRVWLCVAGWLLVLSSTVDVAAQEFVEFRDGRYIRAASHRVVDEVLRIDLDNGSWLLVPSRVVEVIEYKGRIVFDRRVPTETDIYYAKANRPSTGLGMRSGGQAADVEAPIELIDQVLQARRSLPDPKKFRSSPYLASRRGR